MSSPTAHDRASGQENFQSKLETLVLLMQAANEVREMAEIGLLEEMVGSLRAGASEANLPGIGELLRMWTSALHDVSRVGGTLSADDLLQMTMWFMALQEHVGGRLDARGREMLAQMPDGIRWLPPSSPAFVRAIARKLDSSSAGEASMAVAAADVSTDVAPTSVASTEAASIEHASIEHAPAQPASADAMSTETATTDAMSANAALVSPTAWDAVLAEPESAQAPNGAGTVLVSTSDPGIDASAHESTHESIDDTRATVVGIDAHAAEKPMASADADAAIAPAFANDNNERHAFFAADDDSSAFAHPDTQTDMPAAVEVTPELLAQLPPEFLAAFPPGALDDMPAELIEALLLETAHAQDAARAQAHSGGDAIFSEAISEAPSEAFASESSEVFADTASEAPVFAFDGFAFEAAADSPPGIAATPVLAATDAEVAAAAATDALDLAMAHAALFGDTPQTAHAALTHGMAQRMRDGDADIASAPSVSGFDTVAAHDLSEAEAAFAELDTPAAPDPNAQESNTPIWIGREELDLTRQAILEQLMPMAQAWAETPDPEANAPILEELTYQCQLVVNVMELIGTHTLAQGMETIRAGIERRDPAITPEAVATWCSVLLGTIEHPDAQSGESLALVAQDLPGLDDAWQAALVAELARVQVGLDPALIAERKTTATADDIRLAPADDVLPSVLDGMLRELPGNTERFGASVRALADTGAFEAIDEARRVAHTLKGDANTVGVRGLANLTHALEDILIVLAKRPELLSPECADLLTQASDTVEEISDHLLGRGPAPEHLLDTYQHVLDTANALADGADAVPAKSNFLASVGPEDAAASAAAQKAEHADKADIGAADIAQAPAATVLQTGMAASGIQSLNVPSALLDDLQRLAGESLVTARQIDRQLEGLTGLHRDQRQEVRYTQDLISRLDDLVALRGAALQSTAQKAGAELDPLEIDQYNELHVISRQLIEAHADSTEFVRRIDRAMSALADLRNDQEQLNRELQRTILQTRTVPFSQISARLQRIVRQTSKQVLKPVQLELIGESIPLDAELLERVVEPLAHLLRNAIDHGIEAPERRRDAGKPEEGRISMRIGLQGDAAIIDIQDDGAGLNFEAIRARAIDIGVLQADQDADERLLTRLILLPGFSTRSTASEVSGRGIGMDVVNQRIAALRGAMTITSQRGMGMRVSLRLPVTQTLANVIVARGQRQVSAVVSASVERVVSFAQGECVFDAQDGRLWVALGEERVPALPIESFYGASADVRMWLDAAGVGLQVRDADGRAHVVLVAGIDEVRSTVVKPISAYLPPIPAVRGITQLGDGGLAPVIDLDVMLQSAQERKLNIGALSMTQDAPVTRVVVADDSLSVRRALEQLMQDAGFEVETARDGFEALAAIQAKPTHALLVDLEMPRMNGLEVTRNLRTHAETRDLPVVMITSRATDKHQAMAEQAGVTRMLGKPFSEDSLVGLVRDLIAERTALADSDTP